MAKSPKKQKESPPLESVSAPKQARSEQTLQNLLTAAEALIGERGIASVSINDVATAAGSSVGGFYSRFKNKSELLVALSERSQRALQDRVATVMDPTHWADASLADIVESCATELVAHVRDRAKIQAAVLQSVASQPALWSDGVAFRQRLVDGVTALLLTRREEITHENPELAARFATESAFALTDQAVLFGDLLNESGVDDATMAKEIARLVLGYLQRPA